MEFSIENKIIHKILLLSGEENKIGLYYGKMGLVIFFIHYSKYFNNQIYGHFADEIMNEITEEIHSDLPLGIGNGLSGIGWGIEYLIQKGFLDGNSLEICEEIDKKIMEKDIRRIDDYTIETGLGGILHYVLAHMKGVNEQCDSLPFDNHYLKNMLDLTIELSQHAELSDELMQLCKTFIGFYKENKPIDYSMKVIDFIDKTILEEKKLHEYPIGLKNGLAGILFSKYNFSE